MIRNIFFDLGGVVITLDQQQSVRRFEALGLKDAEQRLNAYTQQGIFGDLEGGKIDAETFRKELSKLVGHEVTHEECAFAWQGYAKEVPQRNLDTLQRLRSEGYRVVLLSNTNPYMMEWVDSPAFDGHGHSVRHYFDALYLSYLLKAMKPDPNYFHRVMLSEQLAPGECLFLDDGPRNVAAASQMGIRTFLTENGADWTQEIYEHLKN
jgi:putative hydrolase of the HAD superfamily